MSETFNCCHSLVWVHVEHSLHKTQCFIWQFSRISSLNRFWTDNFRHFETYKSGIFNKHFLLRSSELTQDFLNTMKLINFGVTREERLTITHFPKDAADSPYINWLSIVFITEQEFRRSVPSSSYIICQQCFLPLHRCLWKNSCKTEITNFKRFALRIYKKVFWFDISMNDIYFVTKANGFQKLIYILFNIVFGYSILMLFYNFEQVLFHVFENKKKTSFSKSIWNTFWKLLWAQ